MFHMQIEVLREASRVRYFKTSLLDSLLMNVRITARVINMIVTSNVVYLPGYAG